MSEFQCAHPEADVRTDFRKLEFTTGYYETAWVGNCIAVGNALGFIEPLQSTALTTNAILVEKLSELLADHHQLNHSGIREIFNTFVQSVWENVFDFIALHYRFTPSSAEFWEDMRETVGTERFRQYIDRYHQNGFNSHHDFNQWQFFQQNKFYRVFNQWQFYRVLRGLGVKSEFYDDLAIEIRDKVKRNVERNTEQISNQAENAIDYEDLPKFGIY